MSLDPILTGCPELRCAGHETGRVCGMIYVHEGWLPGHLMGSLLHTLSSLFFFRWSYTNVELLKYHDHFPFFDKYITHG